MEALKVRARKALDRAKSIVFGPPKRIKLGTRYLGKDEPTFIIAEIGINHNGSVEIARKLVDAAAAAGADCVKFQMRDLDSLYVTKDARDPKENLATQYSLDLLTKVHLPPEELMKLFDYAKSKGLFVLCTPFDVASAKRLEEYGMHAYKVGSPDLTNHDLLRVLASTKKPLIVSTGMADQEEISATNRFLRRLGVKYILMHVNSTYPAPFQDIQLQLMSNLGTILYGYSGHERGISVAIAAVARGAKIIEKHITLDREMEGTDHKASLLPDEFRQMVEGIRQVEASFGGARVRTMTQGERLNRANLAKSVVIARAVKKGTVITEELLDVKSPGRGLQPHRKSELLGRTARRDMKAGDPFYPSDLLDHAPAPRPYHFKRPWGLPVRFHDFKEMIASAKPDFVEFHMSYRDLERDPAEFCEGTYDVGLAVHAVETFANDHLLDLSSSDPAYRAESIKNLQRCVDQARALKPFFPKTPRPVLIINAGGFTKDAPIHSKERAALYERVAESLGHIDAEGIELIIQTMPPYPWLLGGQMFHNLFLDADDTAAFCKTYGYRVCLDVSHSHLAGNHIGKTLTEYVHMLGPYIAHLHLVDASGVGEEGLQVGDGSVDWKQLAYDLEKAAPQAPFIPEIWQGHENGGEGFWIALERLEKWF
jgi:N-acetylneuraminate synthase